MTDKTTPPQGTVRPCLDDPMVIRDLLRAHAMAVSQRLAEASHKNVPRDEVIMADRRASAFIASTLLGLNPAYEKAQVNTPKKIETNLRKVLIDDLKQYEIDEKEVKEASVFVQFSMFVFTNHIHELINDLKKNPENIEAEGAQRLAALIDCWYERIAGTL